VHAKAACLPASPLPAAVLYRNEAGACTAVSGLSGVQFGPNKNWGAAEAFNFTILKQERKDTAWVKRTLPLHPSCSQPASGPCWGLLLWLPPMWCVCLRAVSLTETFLNYIQQQYKQYTYSLAFLEPGCF
jgi:hypothetical protein